MTLGFYTIIYFNHNKATLFIWHKWKSSPVKINRIIIKNQWNKSLRLPRTMKNWIVCKTLRTWVSWLNWAGVRTLSSESRLPSKCALVGCRRTLKSSGPDSSNSLRMMMRRSGIRCYITCVMAHLRTMRIRLWNAWRFSTGTRIRTSDARLIKSWAHTSEQASGMFSE